MRAASRALVLGIGGGGDVVGALAPAELCRALGTAPVLGGVTWERLPIDPKPGPRSAAEILDGTEIAPGVLLADRQTRTQDGAVFAESRMAEHLGEQTVLVDPGLGPARIAASLEQAAAELGIDLFVFVDVGGDVLGAGSEPGLASPLCDAVMLAAGVLLERAGASIVGAIFGPGCDGELTIEELLGRLALLAGAGGLYAIEGLTPEAVDQVERAAAAIPTEASAQAVRCARGEVGVATIRGGRRTVHLTPLGAATVYFDPEIALESAAPLARAVLDAPDLLAAQETLHALGIRTELEYERTAGDR
ncbi:MAG TPA: DUF1152 domain-containing protein [Solirubrobacterales bacterium]|nr:DUF1152 domain-containing protein [Solirubrobacterales bacterium]